MAERRHYPFRLTWRSPTATITSALPPPPFRFCPNSKLYDFFNLRKRTSSDLRILVYLFFWPAGSARGYFLHPRASIRRSTLHAHLDCQRLFVPSTNARLLINIRSLVITDYHTRYVHALLYSKILSCIFFIELHLQSTCSHKVWLRSSVFHPSQPHTR